MKRRKEKMKSPITVREDGFYINLYDMKIGKQYQFRYKDTNYEVMRDEKDNLVLTTIEYDVFLEE